MANWRNAYMSPLGALCVLAAAALLGAGCGETVIDSANLEQTVRRSLQRSEGRAIRAVECPSDQEVVVGETFPCTVEFSDGGRATATLMIRNEDADLSLIELKPSEGRTESQ